MNYPGGKNGSGVYQTIINQIPPHDVYIEAFLGSGAILRAKKPAHVTVAVDVCASCMDAVSVPGCVVINDDAISFLRSVADGSVYAGSEIFVYADPPYLKKDIDGSPVRSSQADIYEHEFASVEQHEVLLSVLKSLDCMVMLSGYWSKLYDRELKDWRTITYQSMTRAGCPATEWLWMNYPEPLALHDYSYLGTDHTDRQRIKRKVERWRKKIASMPTLEKRVLLQAMDELHRG